MSRISGESLEKMCRGLDVEGTWAGWFVVEEILYFVASGMSVVVGDECSKQN